MADTTSLDLLNQTQIELLQKYDSALNRFNEINNYFEDGKAIEAINADTVDGFEASQNPSSEQIPVLNTSGQLQLPFNQIPILVNNQELLYRKFYVDAENGDDSNDGSSGAPFATLKKAIDSVPIGGAGDIYLKSGQTFTLTGHIMVHNKVIKLIKWGTDINPVITSVEYVSSDYDAICCFHVSNGSLMFSGTWPDIGIDAVVPTHSGINPIHPVYRGLVLLNHNAYGPACVLLRSNRLTLNKDFHFAVCGGVNYGNEGVFLQLWSVSIDVNDTSSTLIDVFQSPLILGRNYNITIQDNTDSGKTLKDLIAGLVSDGNGFYKNLVGNL